MTENPLVGRRVRLVKTTDPHTRLVQGTEGTVGFVDSLGTVHVNWDDGSNLGMLPGIDRYELVEAGPLAEQVGHELAKAYLARCAGLPNSAAIAFALDLMTGDPGQHKAGYTRENALIAACEVFPQADAALVGEGLARAAS